MHHTLLVCIAILFTADVLAHNPQKAVLITSANPAGVPLGIEGTTPVEFFSDGFEDQEPVQLVITEIMQNPSAVPDSDGEWFELYNAGAVAVDVEGWTIMNASANSHVINTGGSLLIAAGEYLVLGNNGDMGSNGGVALDYVYDSVPLSNGSGSLIVQDAGMAEIDRVDYDNGATFPDPNGASMALTDPALDNNVGTNWCEASTPYGDGDLGTPGGPNDC